MRVVPLTLAQANKVVAELHRHHKPAHGHRFSIGLIDADEKIIGAAICGRPKAHMTPQYEVLDVLRLTTDGTKNAPSMLYGRAARIGKEMGFWKIQTFILESELGTTLKAAGWEFDGMTDGGDWNRPSRGGRRTDQPMEPKQRWQKVLNAPLDVSLKELLAA